MKYKQKINIQVWYHKKNSIEFRSVMERFFCKKILTVLILQNDTFQGHKHNIKMFTYEKGGNGPDGSYFDFRSTKTEDPTDDGVNGTPRTGLETRSKNATVRLWKRIS